VTACAPADQARDADRLNHGRRQREAKGTGPIADVHRSRFHRVGTNAPRPGSESSRSAVEIDHHADGLGIAAGKRGKVPLRHVLEAFIVLPVLLGLAQQGECRCLKDGEARQRQWVGARKVLQHERHCHQAAERMADQMDRGCGRAHDPFQHFDLIRNRTILANAPFVGPSVSKQARADAAKPVAQACDHRPPSSPCAARSRNEHNGGAPSAFVVVDVAESIADH
jgi:hypothetical protein